MRTGSLPAGSKGFDCNCPVSLRQAQGFVNHKYKFAMRYIPRLTSHPNDLTLGELVLLLQAGLAVGPVQHVASETAWSPTPGLGVQYGQGAVLACQRLGVPTGVTVWCDLEGVLWGTPAPSIISYVNSWALALEGAGFLPGLYVGWHNLLTPLQLYHLRVKAYWGAYNLNRDQEPAVRSLQMKQLSAKPEDMFPTCPDIDVDIVKTDLLGGTPTFMLP